jgi:hypothetical protein
MMGSAFAAALVALTALPLTAGAVSPQGGAHIVETSPSGFPMVIDVSKKGTSASLTLACPDGTALGKASGDVLQKGKFKVKSAKWQFTGTFDAKDHLKGHGKITSGACAAGTPATFKEPKPHRARWLACPQNDVLNPYPANTPFTFVGVLPGAALGTHLRIEYTLPATSGSPTHIEHVTTDASGMFSNTFAPPSQDGGEYGSDATARYPDNDLAPGVSCSFDVADPAPAARALAHGPSTSGHSCGALAVRSHPWEQFSHGVEGATGTGWITWWRGDRGSCKIALSQSRAIIDHGGVPAGRKHDCDSEKLETPGVWIEPFHTLTCHVAGKGRDFSFQTIVDPNSAHPVP